MPPSERRRRRAAEPKADGGTSVADIFAHLSKLQSQLELLQTQVRQAQQLASLGTAAATLAHEVNNLLTPIRSYVQAALDSDDALLHRKALTVTAKNADMLVAMSARILAIGAAKPAEREVVCVREAVEDAVASLCRDLPKDGITLRNDVDSSLQVRADALQFRQILFNLFLNAREAMARRHGGILKVTGVPEGDCVRLDVRNSGDPIPPELLPMIFDPLQSSKPIGTAGGQRCTGLGLALCRDLVHENDGTISVTSDAEAGTVFTITLPTCDDAHVVTSAGHHDEATS